MRNAVTEPDLLLIFRMDGIPLECEFQEGVARATQLEVYFGYLQTHLHEGLINAAVCSAVLCCVGSTYTLKHCFKLPAQRVRSIGGFSVLESSLYVTEILSEPIEQREVVVGGERNSLVEEKH